MKNLKSLTNLYFLLRFVISALFLFNYSLAYSQNISTPKPTISFSFFGETGETEDSFTIAGRNFPVKVGSVGLKAKYNLSNKINLYTRAGIGYSPKQTVSAFNFNVSGSVFATSIGAGASGKYRIRQY